MEASHIPMAPPPPPPRVRKEEDAGESSSLPPCCRGLDEVQRRVQERLRRTAGCHDQPALADPVSFQRRLWRHLQRMPPRYLADVDVDAVDKDEDVLLHWRILDEGADPDKRPVFHVRYLKSIPIREGLMDGLSLDREAVDDDESRITSSSRVVPLHLHEVIFCSLDRPKLLCRLSLLFDYVELHIRECHLYCTADGLCLAIFVVDGWETEDADGLIDKIHEANNLRGQRK
ncbi:hypothetical protein QOZ80_8AG0620210 [Eleusine coracana subsp. coracana]|nr:hypothetical protein QOZ80_8AG0620210 [Eleusine coracana subsp. coracana]